MADISKFPALKELMSKENLTDPLSYTICIQIVHGQIVVSQPDLNLYESELSWDGLKNFQQIGKLVSNMYDRIIRNVSEANARGRELPPASSPKEALNIPKQTWVGILEGAQYLNVSENTLRRLCNTGSIRCIRTRGKHRKINLEELERFKREGRTPLVERGRPTEGDPLMPLFDIFLMKEDSEDQAAIS